MIIQEKTLRSLHFLVPKALLVLDSLEVEEVFSYDKIKMEKAVLGTTDLKHPGVRIFNELKDTFIGGKVTLVNIPKFNPPFDKFWYTPKQLRKEFKKGGWKRVVAHQTRNVPRLSSELRYLIW